MWFDLKGSKFKKTIWKTVFFSTLRNIWLARNLVIFENQEFVWTEVIDKALVNAAHWVSSYTGSSDFSVNEFLFNIGAVRSLRLSFKK